MPVMSPDTPVEVWNPYVSSWCSGFVIHEESELGYYLRRLSDGAVLPEAFREALLRPGA